jgi:hypothetical protein
MNLQIFCWTQVSTKNGDSDLLLFELIENPWDDVDLSSTESVVWKHKIWYMHMMI